MDIEQLCESTLASLTEGDWAQISKIDPTIAEDLRAGLARREIERIRRAIGRFGALPLIKRAQLASRISAQSRERLTELSKAWTHAIGEPTDQQE